MRVNIDMKAVRRKGRKNKQIKTSKKSKGININEMKGSE